MIDIGHFVGTPHDFGILTNISKDKGQISYADGQIRRYSLSEIKELDAEVVRQLLSHQEFRKWVKSVQHIRILYPE